MVLRTEDLNLMLFPPARIIILHFVFTTVSMLFDFVDYNSSFIFAADWAWTVRKFGRIAIRALRKVSFF